jgi:hypothetical protein
MEIQHHYKKYRLFPVGLFRMYMRIKIRVENDTGYRIYGMRELEMIYGTKIKMAVTYVLLILIMMEKWKK